MHVEMTFADGTASRHPVEPVMCVAGHDLVPGWAIGSDEGGYDDWTDFLCEAIAARGEREGTWDADHDDEVSFTWRLVGTECAFCLDRLRHWVDQLGMDALCGFAAAAPSSQDRMTRASEAGFGKPDRDQLEHDLWLMRHHVPDLGEVMVDVLQAASGSRGPR